MAKFTVYFRDKAIQSKLFDEGVVRIGRDETNDIVIDSLAIAPVHAVVMLNSNGCVIKEMNDDFPLVINGVHTKEAALQDNDKLTLGKHEVVYNNTESIVRPLPPRDEDNIFDKYRNREDDKPALGNLQVIDGPFIGRILPLKKPMQRLGNDGVGVVVISHRKDGYYVSALEKHPGLTLNHKPLSDETVQLKNNDILAVDNTSMQFFYED